MAAITSRPLEAFRQESPLCNRNYCEKCRQSYKGKECRRCERDRVLGARLRSKKAVEPTPAAIRAERRFTHEQLEREVPEAIKFPAGINWVDVEPVQLATGDFVEVLTMLTQCNRVQQLDEFDQRWTVATK